MNSYQYINPYKPPHPFHLTEKQKLFLKDWEQQRNGSKIRFYFINGFIKKISWLFLFLKLIQVFTLNSETIYFYNSPLGLCFLFFELIFWIFCGIVVGWLNFVNRESRYELFLSMRHF